VDLGAAVTATRFQPAFPLVEAKLHPPTRRSTAIERPRLVDPLLAEAGPAVVAIVAPPGYGKTTLLAQWAEREPRPVAWLTLDDLDNDPGVLLSYLIAAFDRIGAIDDAIQSALLAPRQRILATAVPRLATELYRWERPAVLVLDDAHRLVDRTALDAVAALLDHLPPGFRVAIAGRSEPDLLFARLRAAGDLLEIGTSLLAMTEREAGAVADAEGHELTVEEARALNVRTEGWAAGIHLAALALARGEAESGSLSTVSGRDRYIAAYLRSEFRRHLEPDDVAVLARTSVLETITPPVAAAVSGIENAWGRLVAVSRRSLLIQDVGTAGPAYRYHNLLRDYLQGELDEREPGTRPALHRRAAAWYLAANDLDRAVQHALASGDVDLAAQLVTGATLPAFYGGHAATVDRWIRDLDPRAFEAHAPLAVLAAWMHLLNGRAEAADRMADIAEGATHAGPPGDGSTSFESQRAMLRAIMARRGPEDVLANAQLAVSAEEPQSLWRSNALWLLGSAHLLFGRLDEADAAFDAATAAGAVAGGTAMVAAAKRASIAMARGDWAAAEAFARDARARLTAAHFEEILPSLIVHAVGARLAIHGGDAARAREDLVRAQLIRPLASHAAPWFAVDALLEIARAYLALADPAGAQVALREAEQIVRRRPAIGALTTELVEMRRRLLEAAATLAGSSTLTAAELRLLPLLPTYLSFQEIADRLFISRNTVKTHAMSIYGKLQASSRGEAVERAVELGLLEPFPAFGSVRRAPTD
jgi:LuxR family maltose regulon positive regulatory protein